MSTFLICWILYQYYQECMCMDGRFIPYLCNFCFRRTKWCRFQVNGLATEVRLSQGSSTEVQFKSYEGAIEVLVDGIWGPIVNFDATTAKTICKILGHGFTGFPVFKFRYTGSPLLTLSCVGNETSIKECTQYRITGTSEQYYVAGVHCFAQVFSDMRLTDGEGPNNGTINIKMDGRWGLLCGYPKSSGFSLPEIDLAICRTLGYQRTMSPDPRFGQYGDVYISWLDVSRISCNGDETNLNQCNFTEGTFYQPRCDGIRGVNCITLLNESCTSDDICAAVANAVCTGNTCKCRHGYLQTGMDICTAVYGFRLMSVGDNTYEGIVEVKVDGNWVVMSSNYTTFDNRTASLLCKTLGLSTYGYSTTSLQAVDLKKNVTLYEDLLVCSGHELDATGCDFGVLGHRKTSKLEAGWTKLHCSLCDDDRYGRNCSQLCDCELNNVDLTINKRSCDAVTGSCVCKSDWTGSRCAIVLTPEDTKMLIIIITLAAVIFLLLVVIVIVCLYKYRKRTRKEFDGTSPKDPDETLKTGKSNNYELTATTKTASVAEYNTINDSMVDVDMNADTEYDVHPDLLERTDRSDGRTDENDGNESDGYMTPEPTGTGSANEYVNTRIELNEEGYRTIDTGKRQLPEVSVDDEMKLDHPYEDLKDRRQVENVYSKMAENK